MRTFTVDDILSIDPAFDYLPGGWTGTALDLLQEPAVPYDDRLWIAFHWIGADTLRRFALWCAVDALCEGINPVFAGTAVLAKLADLVASEESHEQRPS